MKVNLENKEIELKYGFRAMIVYEKIMDTSFAPKGLTEILVFFYSVIVASDKDNDINLTYDGFMDWLDENPEKVGEFSEWLNSVLTKQSQFKKESEEGEKKEGDPEPKKE